jgi:L-threonylcarbamoyladenylate synthase
MRTWKVDDSNPGAANAWLDEAVAELRWGGVLAIPTDTYYGLAADARSPRGLAQVLRLKGSRRTAPLLVLVADVAAARTLAPDADDRLDALAARFWPGPLTVVLPAPAATLPELVGPSAGIAVRVPAAPVARALAAGLGGAITGTSANRTGAAPPDRVQDIELDSDLLAGTIDAGAVPGGAPSTLIDITSDVARLLRDGPVPAADLRESLDGRLL